MGSSKRTPHRLLAWSCASRIQPLRRSYSDSDIDTMGSSPRASRRDMCSGTFTGISGRGRIMYTVRERANSQAESMIASPKRRRNAGVVRASMSVPK